MAVFHFYQLDFLVVLTIHGRSDRACMRCDRTCNQSRPTERSDPGHAPLCVHEELSLAS
jgi:hypothetical protein